MKKLRWFAITLFLLSVVLYALDQNQIRRKTDQTIPKISMDQDEIQVSVKDPEKVWKKGITAYDEKDGDITDSLVIESVSTFLEKGRRLVSYAAFDRVHPCLQEQSLLFIWSIFPEACSLALSSASRSFLAW